MSNKFSHSSRTCSFALGAFAIFHSVSAMAVDGLYLSALGVKSAGMAGTSIAFPQDSGAAGTNPAGMGLVGSRTDLGVELLEPLIDYQYGSSSNTLHSGKVYPVPEGGGQLANNSACDIWRFPIWRRRGDKLRTARARDPRCGHCTVKPSNSHCSPNYYVPAG